MSLHREVVARILASPVNLLVVPSDSATATNRQVEGWDVGDADVSALVELGVPIKDENNFIGNIQLGELPEIEDADRSFYSLGIYLQNEIGVAAGEGTVWGIPLNDSLSRFYVNSSIALYVDVAWRWYWILREVVPLQNDIEQCDLLDDFINYVVKVDMKVATEGGLWRGIVDGW